MNELYEDGRPLTVAQLRMAEKEYFVDYDTPFLEPETDAPSEAPADEQEVPVAEFSEVPLSEVSEKDYPVKEEPSITVDLSRVGPGSPNWMKAFFSCIDYAHEVQLNPPRRLARFTRSGGSSSLPTHFEFMIDTELAAKKALVSPKLLAAQKLSPEFIAFRCVYLQKRVSEDKLPKAVQDKIQMKVGKELVKRGIFPIARYLNLRSTKRAEVKATLKELVERKEQ
jgi:hypothetical protein